MSANESRGLVPARAIPALLSAIILLSVCGVGVAQERMAIAEFVQIQAAPGQEDIGWLAAEAVQHRLVSHWGFEIAERARLQQIRGELALVGDPLFDKTTFARFGRLLGVKSLVCGTIVHCPHGADIFSRVLDVEEGTVQASAYAFVPAGDEVVSSSDLADALASALVDQRTDKPRLSDSEATRLISAANLRYQIAEYRRSLQLANTALQAALPEPLELQATILSARAATSLSQGLCLRLGVIIGGEDPIVSNVDSTEALAVLDGAAESLDAIIDRYPSSPEVPDVLFWLGRVELARACASEHFMVSDSHAQMSSIMQGRQAVLTIALRYFESAREAAQHDHLQDEAFLYQGIALRALARYAEAGQVFDRIVRASTNNDVVAQARDYSANLPVDR